jgi:hypothetical protein
LQTRSKLYGKIQILFKLHNLIIHRTYWGRKNWQGLKHFFVCKFIVLNKFLQKIIKHLTCFGYCQDFHYVELFTRLISFIMLYFKKWYIFFPFRDLKKYLQNLFLLKEGILLSSIESPTSKPVYTVKFWT